jgi:hypothetical protein
MEETTEEEAAAAATITIPAPTSYPALYMATSATVGEWVAQTGPPGPAGPAAPNTWG